MFKALRKKAIQNIEAPTLESYVEQCYRHYSKTYFTPLHEAREKVTVPEVVMIYMEDEMSEMDKESLQEYKEQLGFVTEAVLTSNSESAEVLDDDAWFIQMSKKIKEEEQKKQEKKAAEVVKQVDDKVKAFTEKITNMTKSAEEDVSLDFDE